MKLLLDAGVVLIAIVAMPVRIERDAVVGREAAEGGARAEAERAASHSRKRAGSRKRARGVTIGIRRQDSVEGDRSARRAGGLGVGEGPGNALRREGHGIEVVGKPRAVLRVVFGV